MTTDMSTTRFGNNMDIRPRSVARKFDFVLPDDLEDTNDQLESIAVPIDIGLPILATGNDMREVVRFLKNKPFGVTIIEAMNAEPRRVFDGRKIAAYEFWGIVERDADRLRLSGLGQELANRIKPERDIHRRILRSIPTYFGALELFYDQRLKIVTRLDAINYWKGAHPELDLFSHGEKNVEAIVVSFFSVCHAADLGTLTIGKRGQPARLRIDLDELADFFESGDAVETSPLIPWPKPKADHDQNTAARGRIYLAGRRDGAAVSATEHIRTVLELADFDDIVYQSETSDYFLPESELIAIHQCQAAIFLLDESDCIPTKNGQLELRGSKLAQISVAMAVLNGRVVLLWHRPDGEPPEGLCQTNLHIFDGENFDWNSGARLVKQIKSFRP